MKICPKLSGFLCNQTNATDGHVFVRMVRQAKVSSNGFGCIFAGIEVGVSVPSLSHHCITFLHRIRLTPLITLREVYVKRSVILIVCLGPEILSTL